MRCWELHMPIKSLFEPALIMVQSTVMSVTHLSVSSNLPAKLGRKVQGGYCKLQEAVCWCLRSSYHSFMSAVVRLARRRIRCQLSGRLLSSQGVQNRSQNCWVASQSEVMLQYMRDPGAPAVSRPKGVNPGVIVTL